MSKRHLFTINSPQVVAEVIEGELVAIHLENGIYYHSNKTGSFIWQLVTNGYPTNEISDLFAKKFDLTVEKSTSVVEGLVDKFVKEKLIKTVDNFKPAALPKSVFAKARYEKPDLSKNTDMKELLLLDPIHDIGDGAWPMKPVS